MGGGGLARQPDQESQPNSELEVDPEQEVEDLSPHNALSFRAERGISLPSRPETEAAERFLVNTRLVMTTIRTHWRTSEYVWERVPRKIPIVELSSRANHNSVAHALACAFLFRAVQDH